MFFEDWVTFWSLQSLWWAIGVFFVAALVEMWFPPFPGDAFYFLGLVSMSAGKVSVMAAIAAACAGGLFGYAGLYVLGAARGRRLFMRRTTGLLSESSLRRLEKWFARWGGWVIIFGRFLVGIRSAVPVAAGIGLYPRTRALTFGLLSILIWNGLLAFGALALGRNWEYVARVVRTYNIAFWALVTAGVAAWGVWKLVQRQRSIRKQ
jgi:membrane protein DedA with SNARE-associated domain